MATAATTTEKEKEKSVMVVGIDDSEHSFYALEWALDHFFTPSAPNSPYKLFIVHAKPTAASVVGLAGPGTYYFIHTCIISLIIINS